MIQTIFIVEDDDDLSRILELYLSIRGYVVTISKDLRQSNKILDAFTFDAAIIDIGLPDGNGFDLVNRLNKKNKKIPILIISGRDINSIVNVLSTIHYHTLVDFIPKPISVGQINFWLNKYN